MALPATCLVALGTTDLDRRPLGGSGLAIDQALIPGRQITTHHTDRVQLVDPLGDGEQPRDRPEGFPAKVHVGSRDDHPNAAVGDVVHHADNAVVEELGFVDRDHVDLVADLLRDLDGGSDRVCLQFGAVMGTDPEDAPVAVVEVGLEDLNVLLCDQGPTHASQQLFGLSAEHHA